MRKTRSDSIVFLIIRVLFLLNLKKYDKIPLNAYKQFNNILMLKLCFSTMPAMKRKKGN